MVLIGIWMSSEIYFENDMYLNLHKNADENALRAKIKQLCQNYLNACEMIVNV